MPASIKLPRLNSSKATTVHARCGIEPLERRTFLSAAWTTVDDYVTPPPASPWYADAEDMASDGAGGLYAVGEALSQAPNIANAVVRHQASGSSVWQTVATVQGPSGTAYRTAFDDVAVAPNGDVYLSGIKAGPTSATYSYAIWKGTLNAEGTTLSLSEVDNVPVYLSNGQANPARVYNEDVAVDAAGNVFSAGWRPAGSNNIRHWLVRKQTAGQGAFATVNDFVFNNTDTRPSAMTVIPSGVPGAGVYVVGAGGGPTGSVGTGLGTRWIVRKSTNGGSTWSTVDTFQLEPSTKAPTAASDVVAHEDGTVHVVGRVSTRVQTGGTKKNPTYSYDYRWYMRSSSNGGSTWSGDDLYPENTSMLAAELPYVSSTSAVDPQAVVTDQAGKVYVAGPIHPSSADSRSIVRTNASGAWSTSDDFHADGDGYTRAYGLARDSSGDLYLGGMAANHWSVRSMTSAAPLARSVGTGGSIFADSPLRDRRDDILAELA